MSDKKTYLFVDDSRVSRMKIRQLVAKIKPEWELVEAISGEEAKEKTSTIRPDFISLDINMPGMGGIEAVSHLRSNCPAAKIVLLSGNVQDDMKAQGQALGVGFVEKPITEACIASVIAFFES